MPHAGWLRYDTSDPAGTFNRHLRYSAAVYQQNARQVHWGGTFLNTLITLKLSQPEKAPFSMIATELGSVIDVSDLQLLKA